MACRTSRSFERRQDGGISLTVTHVRPVRGFFIYLQQPSNLVPHLALGFSEFASMPFAVQSAANTRFRPFLNAQSASNLDEGRIGALNP